MKKHAVYIDEWNNMAEEKRCKNTIGNRIHQTT
jgi:hypothetical protein